MTETPVLHGIHHLKIPVSDLSRSLDFYERSLDATRIPEADHRRHSDGALYAYLLRVPGVDGLLELRLDSKRALAHSGFDPITLAVPDRQNLTLWHERLTARHIKHSPVITAIQAWLIVIEDPDGHRIRLYTLEQHGPELPPDETNPWVS
ncbi:VOC family protein [Leifsonia sp. AG29]|uniref:VOC family protein n=1 Tax=Leifsonia sp. AG29 TaxID=2598860 RepID=UPI00131E2AF2|nr:VOC family protein [Leifsonia sp. AG29]